MKKNGFPYTQEQASRAERLVSRQKLDTYRNHSNACHPSTGMQSKALKNSDVSIRHLRIFNSLMIFYL